MWGGHSCPPPLTLMSGTEIHFASQIQDAATIKIKMKGGGQECPSHTEPLPFGILGHRADDLVVPDPGPEQRSRLSGRIGSLSSSAEPYERRFFQRNPRQGLTLSFLVTTVTSF